MPIAMFVVFFGYHLFQEWLWSGKTIGKILFGIRVVRDNGQAIGFWEAFGRNLLRVVDVYLSGIGLLVLLFNRDEKRLGDFLSGTIVISQARVSRPRRPRPDGLPSNEANGSASGLSPEEFELLSAFQARKRQWLPAARQRMMSALEHYLSERLQRSVEGEAALDALLTSDQPATEK
jgi:hypothetical protein